MMESGSDSLILPDKQEIDHSQNEIKNIYRCCKVERMWLKSKDNPQSSRYIRQLHYTLFEGVEDYEKKGITRGQAGSYRREDVWTSGKTADFFVRGLDVGPLMDLYTKQLDQVIETLPSSPLGNIPQVIHEAAWAYYVYTRIHPFLDGNGRVGRMVVNRILNGAGFKHLIYNQEAGNGKKNSNGERNKHLEAMRNVDKTGSLDSIALFLAENLVRRYTDSPADQRIKSGLESFIEAKHESIQSQLTPRSLSETWLPFKNLELEGVTENY